MKLMARTTGILAAVLLAAASAAMGSGRMDTAAAQDVLAEAEESGLTGAAAAQATLAEAEESGRVEAAAVQATLAEAEESGLTGAAAVQDVLAGGDFDAEAAQTGGEEILPARWYAGDYGKKPVVRSQGKYGTCWALTAVSALEAALLPQEHIVFSADHLSRNNAFVMDSQLSGDCYMTMAYLSGWQGPVTEEEDPYGDEYSPAGLSAAVHVQEIQLLEDASVDEIKRAVYTYGAVGTSLYMSRRTTADTEPYYNSFTCAYYYPGQEIPDHDVLILGWDDSYSRLHFKTMPKQDGAFICQNTWGEFGRDGIFYVSYEDANIGSVNLAYSRIDPADNYDRIYQTDDCGWQGKQGYDDETCWFANVYEAVEEEYLAAAGFYATGPETAYEVYLVHDFAGTASFGQKELLQKGSFRQAGYYTVDLDAQRLAAGERFAVIVKITTPGEVMPVAVEFRADEYTANVTTEGKEGYLSQSGEIWENTEEKFGTNVCLKAYTVR